ncbi:MAG: HXXEE domain-containing protein [Planctomycetota bacterium]
MDWLKRLIDHWVYGGFMCSFVLLAGLTLSIERLTLPMVLLFLHLPMYMWHQYEEHDDDRFRTYCDVNFGVGSLNQEAIFIINVIGVWGIFTALLMVASIGSVGWGLGIVYLTMINGISHVASAVRQRGYNPGLLTAALLFIPLSGFSLIQIARIDDIRQIHHFLGVSLGIGIHLLIVMYVLKRRAAIIRSPV